MIYLNTNKPHHIHGEHIHVQVVGVLLGHGDGHVHHQVHGILRKLKGLSLIEFILTIWTHHLITITSALYVLFLIIVLLQHVNTDLKILKGLPKPKHKASKAQV